MARRVGLQQTVSNAKHDHSAEKFAAKNIQKFAAKNIQRFACKSQVTIEETAS